MTCVFSDICWVMSAAAIQSGQNINKVGKVYWGKMNGARKIVIN